MSEEQQEKPVENDRMTPITHPWGVGGPKTAEHRKLAKAWFIVSLKQDPNISLACDYAGISRNPAYQWREKDPNFAEEWDNAIERAKDVARSSIYKRGVLGWDEPVVAQGRVALDEKDNRLLLHKWSDSLAALYARANLPEYKDKQTIDLTAQITTMADSAKDELLADLSAAIANENKEPPDQG